MATGEITVDPRLPQRVVNWDSSSNLPVPTGATNSAQTNVGQAPSNANVAAYVSSLILKVGAGRLWGVSGYNSRTSSQFIQLFDALTAASGAIPVGTPVLVPASSNFSIDFGYYGRSFATGIIAANSSVAPTQLAGSADCWFEGRYT